MKLARSKIHRWGVYATEFIPAGRKVIEYTGERINRRETKRRADLRTFTYLFTLDPYWTIDGAAGGSGWAARGGIGDVAAIEPPGIRGTHMDQDGIPVQVPRFGDGQRPAVCRPDHPFHGCLPCPR